MPKKEEETEDTNIGLKDFLIPEESLVKEAEKPEGEETSSQEEEKPEQTEQEKPVESEEKPQEAEVPVEAKEEEKKEEVKPPPVNWDDETNPYRKRYFDTQKWGNKEHEKFVRLEKEIQALRKEINPDYEPEKEDRPKEEDTVRYELMGRVKASEAAAYTIYGKSETENLLNQFNTEFGDNDAIQTRVTLSETPVLEAIKVLKESQFTKQFEGKSIEEIVAEAERRGADKEKEKYKKSDSEKFIKRAEQKENEVQGLSEAKGTSNREEKVETEHKPLSQLFR